MLSDFQQALAELTASPRLCLAVRRNAAVLRERYALSEREQRQVLAMAQHPAMECACGLYRANRLAPLFRNLPRTLEALGERLEPILNAYWESHPWPYRYGYLESERFCQWLEPIATEPIATEPIATQPIATAGGARAGDALAGDTSARGTPGGSATSGNAAAGDTTAGDTTAGNAIAGNATARNATAGNASEGNVAAGDATAGDATAGHCTVGATTVGASTVGAATAPLATIWQAERLALRIKVSHFLADSGIPVPPDLLPC